MYGFKAFLFDGKKTAGKAFNTLEDYTPAYVWIDDVAVISRSKYGSTRVHSTWAQDDSEVGAGTGLGAVTGGADRCRNPADSRGCPYRMIDATRDAYLR